MPRLALAFLLMAACATFPEVDRAVSASGTQAGGAVPVLVPLEGLLAQAAPGRATDASRDAVAGRAAGLRARAAAMRGPVQDAATRARLAAAIAAHPVRVN